MLRKTDASWSNPKVLAILSVIFLCGAAFGSAVTRGYIHGRMANRLPASHAMETARRVGLKDLKQRLNLTVSQEQTVNKVLDDYGKFYQNIEDEREDVADYGRRRILNVLNPDQKKQFDEIFGNKSRQ